MEVQQITKISLCWELYESGVPKRHIAKKLDLHHETVGIWITGITEMGLIGFLDKYQSAKKGPRIKS